MANMTSTNFGKERSPIPSIRLHSDPTHRDNTPPLSGSQEGGPLTIVTTTGISSPKSPRTLRRTNKKLSLSTFVRPNADRLVPPDPLIPLSPPPIPMSHSHDLPNTLFTPYDSPTSHRSFSGVANNPPTITCSPPTPLSAGVSQGIQPSSPSSSPVLPRIGTHKRPYFSTVRASKNSRRGSDVSPLSSPTSPSSITFPICSSIRQSVSSASSARFVRSETGLTAEIPATTPAYGSTTSYSPNDAQESPIVTVPPLPPLLPPSPTSIPFQMRVAAPSQTRGALPVLDLAQNEDEIGNVHCYDQFGMNKVRPTKHLGTKKSGKSKEKFKNPLTLSLSSGRQRGHSFGFGSDKGKEVTPSFPTLLTSRSFAGLGSTVQGSSSLSGEMESKMTSAERDTNSGKENDNNSTPASKFRESQRQSHDGRERNRGRSGGRKLVKTRSSIGFSSNSTAPSGSSPSRIGLKLREMMSHSFLGKFHGNDASRS